jgi:hypothetical protein
MARLEAMAQRGDGCTWKKYDRQVTGSGTNSPDLKPCAHRRVAQKAGLLESTMGREMLVHTGRSSRKLRMIWGKLTASMVTSPQFRHWVKSTGHEISLPLGCLRTQTQLGPPQS